MKQPEARDATDLALAQSVTRERRHRREALIAREIALLRSLAREDSQYDEAWEAYVRACPPDDSEE